MCAVPIHTQMAQQGTASPRWTVSVDILAGLQRTGFLKDDGGVHLDALKVQHYGSEHDMDAVFARRVSAEADGRKFHFWFRTTAVAQDVSTKKHAHFRKVEQEAEKLARQSKGMLKLHFNKRASITLTI